MQKKYSLTWQTYSDHLKSMMKELMMNEDFSDVTLVTEDKKHIKANMNILSACSPVLKDIFKKESNSRRTTMYLRGIQFSEMEAIVQFIYLGEATVYEERKDEFLAVAKSLEIKELCETETKKEPEDKPLPSDPSISTENLKGENVSSDDMELQTSQDIREDTVSISQEYECWQSVHENVKYACDQCDYQAKQQRHLYQHIQSKHEGVKFACDQCDHQATRQSHLKSHILTKHEGVRYACDLCDYQATRQSSLTRHVQTKHEGVKYKCNQCDYMTSWQGLMSTHIKYEH